MKTKQNYNIKYNNIAKITDFIPPPNVLTWYNDLTSSDGDFEVLVLDVLATDRFFFSSSSSLCSL